MEGKARFLYSLPFPPSSNGMKWYAMILIVILIAIPADANFLNGDALNGSVLVGYVLKIRTGGICIGGIRLRFLLMHTFWMDTHWMDTHSMDTYWWDTCWTDTYWWDTYCKTCWCKRFEWIRIAWIRTGGIRVERIRIGGIRIANLLMQTFWMHTHCMDTYWWDTCWTDTYWWDTYWWDTFWMDMCGICVVWWICVGYVWCEICVGYVWCEIRQQSSEEPCDETSFGKKIMYVYIYIFMFQDRIESKIPTLHGRMLFNLRRGFCGSHVFCQEHHAYGRVRRRSEFCSDKLSNTEQWIKGPWMKMYFLFNMGILTSLAVSKEDGQYSPAKHLACRNHCEAFHILGKS